METRGTADQTDGGQRTGRRRRSIRLKGYDYAQAGAYFVTVCTQERACLFGDVVDGEMLLSDAGRIVQTVWEALPNHYPYADLDAWIIMPNHVHAVIVLGAGVGAGLRPARAAEVISMGETGQTGQGRRG